MTAPRPGGVTARGLHYPGNDITVDTIPDAMRVLATDIDTALGSPGAAGYTVSQVSTSVQLNRGANALTPAPSSQVAFPALRAVVGCVANWGTDFMAAGLLLAWSGNVVTVLGVQTGGLDMKMYGTNNVYRPQYVAPRNVVVNFIAWGPKA